MSTIEASDKPKRAKAPRQAAMKGYNSYPRFDIIADSALVSWMGGIALHQGFGVSVPFMAGWLGLAAVLVMVSAAASQVAGSHNREAVKAAPYIAAAQYAGTLAAAAAISKDE